MTAYVDRSSKTRKPKPVSERDYFGYGTLRPRAGGVDFSRCCHRDVTSKSGKRTELRCGSVERPDGRKGKPKCGWYGDTLGRTVSGRIMRCDDCLKEGRHHEP